MKPNSRALKALADGKFSADDFELIELTRAFDEIREGFIWARKFKNKNERNERLRELSDYSNIIIKAIAQKWAERGPKKINEKIRDLERKAEDPERSLNPYDSVFLEFLISARDGLNIK